MIDRDVQLSNGTITLRPYRAEDADSLYEAAVESRAELSPWMPWCHPDYRIEESRTFVEERPEKWEQGLAYDFAISDSASGLYLGGCGLSDIQRSKYDNGLANLGYWVRTSRTKKGVATAATRLLAGFAFDVLKLSRVEIVIAVENKASQRVAEKAGATREGVLRNRLSIHGEPVDAVMFSLIPQDMERGV